MLSASRKLRYGVGKYVDNPFRRFVSTLQSYDGFHKMYGLAEMNDPKVGIILQMQIHSPSLLGSSWRML